MKAEINEGIIKIDLVSILENMNIQEKKTLLNLMKLEEDFFTIFMEYLSWEETELNDKYNFYTSKDTEWRKETLLKMQEKFDVDIKHLKIIQKLEEHFWKLYSNERIYWEIYHEAPEYIKEWFKIQEWYKSEYDYKNEKQDFINEIKKLITKQ